MARDRLFLPVLALLALAGAAAAAEPARLEVDARAAPRGIMQAHLRLPATPGPLTLLYPKWLPGRHAPSGPITSLGGPRLQALGRPIPWRRDPVDPYVFHLTVPEGAHEIEVDLELLTAPAPDGIVQGLEAPRTATESLALVEWNQLLLYPAGPPTDALSYEASIRLPEGWHYASALREAAGDAAPGVVRFEPVSLTSLVDSTLLAGRYWRSLELSAQPPVWLHIAADRPAQLRMDAATEQHYRNLVPEALALFGAVHFRHYDFLWTLTDQIMPDGLEHHESSDNRSPARALLDEPIRRAEANLLPHEFAHSWNGKYRRPVGLATPDYQAPMDDALLWVYEGLTEYLGDVLAVRSGLFTPQEFRDELARVAAQMDVHKGRDWRSLQDSTDAAPLLYSQDHNWGARLRRQDDFYQESALLWLEADTLIRSRSGGKRSLDDFCRAFHGAPSTAPQVRPYDFDAVVAALQSVEPYDWRGFWTERLQRLGGGAPLQGLRAAGWRLALQVEPSTLHAAHEVEDRALNLQYSLGFALALDGGTISDIVPDSPADRAGMAPGSHLVAVNGHKWSPEVLAEALGAEAQGNAKIVLLVEKDDEYRSVELTYAGGARYPQLVREGGPDLLAAIARPLRPAAK